jgi:hypothetical protein
VTRFNLLLLFTLLTLGLNAQQIRRCAAVDRLQQKFNTKKGLQFRFEQRRAQFNKSIESGYFRNRGQAVRLEGGVYAIPVVVHIVLPDPSVVTDKQVLAQLDTLNKAFAGTNGDASKIPSYFQSLAGKSIFQFCLAQRTPEGLPATGIHRVSTNRNSFSINTEGVKYTSLGGTDSWDSQSYLNIWITALSDGILGYSSFPGDEEPAEQGVVIDYRALPGGIFDQYDNGKTLVHETGHFFNLYHIWGDDNGTCRGSDFVDDTPPQANSTSTCSSGRVFDNCTSAGDGIMYQNYMDYTGDDCLIMFTNEQVSRMEAAASTYFTSLLNSNACEPVILNTNDAAIVNVEAPEKRLCVPDFSPQVTIKNAGENTLKSLKVQMVLDNRDPVTVTWTGNLAYSSTASVAFENIAVEQGAHTIEFILSSPNGNTDENSKNDTLSKQFQYYLAVNELSEGFEQPTFAPRAWDIVSADSNFSWKRSTEIAASGNAAASLEGPASGSAVSLLRLPELNLQNIDSAWLSFSVTSSADTFELMLSRDCGQTYTSLYEISGGSLRTTTAWLKDSVNLTPYIGQGNILLAFKAATSESGNVFLDDISLRKVVVNPNLKTSGFLVTPNPASGLINIQFYPQPTGLKAIRLFNSSGQLVRNVQVSQQYSLYTMDVSSLSSGVYILSVVFADRIIQRRIGKVQ